MAVYVVKKNDSKYYTGFNYDGNNWGEINNAKKFHSIPYSDRSYEILEIKPDGKMVQVR